MAQTRACLRRCGGCLETLTSNTRCQRRGEPGAVLFYLVGAGAFVVLERGRRWPSSEVRVAATGLQRRGDGRLAKPTAQRSATPTMPPHLPTCAVDAIAARASNSAVLAVPLRVNHSRHPHARVRREAPIPDRGFIFLFQQRGPRRRCRGWRRWPPLVPAAELNRGRARRWLRRPPDSAVRAPRQPFSAPSRAREARGARRRFEIAVSFFSFSSADRAGAAEVGGAGRRWCRRRSSIAAELRGGCRRPPAPPLRRRGSASTILGTLTRARGARRRFQIAVSFFSFSSADRSADRAGAAAVGRADGAHYKSSRECINRKELDMETLDDVSGRGVETSAAAAGRCAQSCCHGGERGPSRRLTGGRDVRDLLCRFAIRANGRGRRAR